jgi:hypothetical protein
MTSLKHKYMERMLDEAAKERWQSIGPGAVLLTSEPGQWGTLDADGNFVPAIDTAAILSRLDRIEAKLDMLLEQEKK